MLETTNQDGMFNYMGHQLYHSGFQPDWLDFSPEIIFEFGSFDGGDAIRLKAAYPKSTIYSFEPDPGRCSIIEKLGILIHYAAISDRNGIASFERCIDPNEGDLLYGPAGSLLKHKQKHLETFNHLSYELINVPTITLASFCLVSEIPKIDLLHMDVEGAELKVLHGLGKWLRPKAIFLECHMTEFYEGAAPISVIEDWMHSNNYDCKVITEVDRLYVRNSN